VPGKTAAATVLSRLLSHSESSGNRARRNGNVTIESGDHAHHEPISFQRDGHAAKRAVGGIGAIHEVPGRRQRRSLPASVLHGNPISNAGESMTFSKRKEALMKRKFALYCL